VICPACKSEKIKKFSELPEKEFKCEDCGKEFGTSNVNTPTVE
jgi:transposase-like protein